MDVLNSVLIYFKKGALSHTLFLSELVMAVRYVRNIACIGFQPSQTLVTLFLYLRMRFTLVTVSFEMRFKTMVLSFSLQQNRRVLFTKGIQMEQPMYKSILWVQYTQPFFVCFFFFCSTVIKCLFPPPFRGIPCHLTDNISHFNVEFKVLFATVLSEF